MAKFDVEIPHALPVGEVRTRLERARTKLEKDYGATCSWEGDEVLLVKRKGLDARVAIEPSRLHVGVELGLLMSAMSGAIRTGITKQLTDLVA